MKRDRKGDTKPLPIARETLVKEALAPLKVELLGDQTQG